MRALWTIGVGLGVFMMAACAFVPRVLAQAADDVEALRQRVSRLEQTSAVAAGREVYSWACASCHGERGDGHGPAARRFVQAPTDFTKGVYTLQSNLSESPESDLPTDADLARTIREGMSGTEMVPFRNVLSAASIAAVVQYIKTFSPRFSDPALPAPDSSVLKPPQARPFPPSPESAAAGKEIYKAKSCADCHGEQGEGNPDEKNKFGVPVHMNSFKAGYFKSGSSDADLFRTLSTGMRGTEMDAYHGTMTDQEMWQLIDYVRSLAQRPKSAFGTVIRYLFTERPSGLDYSHPVAMPVQAQ